MFDCCSAGPPLKGQASKSLFGGSAQGTGSHSMLRDGPKTGTKDGPRMWQFILVPWFIAVVILVITVLSQGASVCAVVIPALLVCIATAVLAWEKRVNDMPTSIFCLLCCLAAFSAFIVSLVTYIHFLEPYHSLGMGATYLDMLPSQSALGASDASAIVFAPGTSVDTHRTYGYVDARNPGGTVYCVAPVSNQWTIAEPSVQFFAAGTDCCGKRGAFGCSQGGNGARGALLLATEETAQKGYKNAVEGAAVAYGLQPGNGYLLLTMVSDPMKIRNDKYDGAVKLLLIYIFVYLVIACMTGYMAHNAAKK